MLVSDGRHTTLGRHSDPSESEILAAEAHLVDCGLGGWLAIAEGDFHVADRPPRLMEVRRLGRPAAAFSQAAAAFARHQAEANSG